MRSLCAASLAVAIAAIGCTPGRRARSDPPRQPASSIADAPPTDRELPTTDGAIAFGNLEGQIRVLEASLAARPNDVEAKRRLVELLSARGQIRARVADYERALALAEEVVRGEPRSAEAYLARAGARANLHLFDAAEADLGRAEALGVGRVALAPLRGSILQAKGDLDAALTERRRAREAQPTIATLGAEAALLGEMGDAARATALFREARLRYRDVSPFPVAWLLFQEGLFWDHAHEPAIAKAFYASAHARLPVHAHAAAHLAAFEGPARAIDLLEAVAAASDDPEFDVLVAERLRQRGAATASRDRVDRARTRYEALVASHPEAFADHAGWFYLDVGNDAPRALAFAQQNLTTRATSKAYELFLLAANAAGDHGAACAGVAEASGLRYPSELLRDLTRSSCR